MADLPWQRTSTEPASRVTNGKVSSRQVVDAHLDRIGEVSGWAEYSDGLRRPHHLGWNPGHLLVATGGFQAKGP